MVHVTWWPAPEAESVSLLCVFSGAGQHREGGGGGGALVRDRGAPPPLQAEDPGVCARGREGTAVDRPHQDVPAVRGEVRGGRVPLHRDSAVRGGLDGLRPALQGLPAVVRRGAAAGDQPLSHGHGLSA